MNAPRWDNLELVVVHNPGQLRIDPRKLKERGIVVMTPQSPEHILYGRRFNRVTVLAHPYAIPQRTWDIVKTRCTPDCMWFD